MADLISRLKLDSGEFDSKIKRASQELMAYQDHCKKVGLEMGYANADAKKFAQQLGSMTTTSQTARGKIAELTAAFTDLSVMYKNMTEQERNNTFGKNLAVSLDQLKGRISEAKQQLAEVNQELSGSKFGQFGQLIDGVGQKMGINANLTELLTSKTALMTAGMGAAVAAIGKATEAWASYNQELARQDQVTQVTTGLQGTDANKMTDQTRALVDTYNIDFREAINAANTLMTQFGKSGDEAMQLLKDGMQGMIQGDGPKLLSMIQQYAPAFRDAGVSASQLVAVIHNTEGGIFTDQNMNAIVMGIKNIRLMTKSTSEALAQLGIDGQEMSRKLNDGSMTVFDALKQVASGISRVDSSSQAAGEVMQQVFGRQGVTAGTNLGKAIETLNTNLEETKRQTGEVGDAMADLQEANERLNTAIRDCFEYDGWGQMATGIRSKLVTALAAVVEKLAEVRRFLMGMNGNDMLGKLGGSDKVNRMVGNLQGARQENRQSVYDQQTGAFESYINPRKKYLENLDKWRSGDRSEGVKAEVDWGREKFGIDDRAIRSSVKAAEQMLDEYEKKAKDVFSSVNKESEKLEIKPTPTKTNTKTGSTATTPAQQAAKSVQTAEQEYTRALEKARIEVESGTATTADQKKAEYRALESLWTAYSKAADTVPSNEGYRQRMTELEGKLVKLGSEVTQTTAAQEAAKKAASEQAEKWEKMEASSVALYDAQSRNNLGDFYKANQQYKSAGGGNQLNASTFEGGFTATTGNIDAFIKNLKGKIAQADLGGDLYNNLTAQLADTEHLSNLLQVAIKNGIDPKQVGINPQEFWDKVFGDNPGDYIQDSTWENIVEKLNAVMEKEGIKLNLNTNTGEIKEGKVEDDKMLENASKVVSGLSQVASGLQSMGIKLPDSVQKVLGVAQGLMSVIQGVNSIISVFATSAEVANTTAVAANTVTAGSNTVALAALTTAVAANTAALATNTATNFIPFFANGGIVHAANGFSGVVPGRSFSGDNIPIMANSGEVVLNAAQTNGLANALRGGGMESMSLETVIEAESIRLILNNNGERTGNGEYLVARMG